MRLCVAFLLVVSGLAACSQDSRPLTTPEAVGAPAATAKKKPPVPPSPLAFTLPLRARGFDTIPTNQTLSNDSEGALVIPIGTAVARSTNYVYSTGAVPKVIAGHLVVTVAIETSPDAVVSYQTEPWNTCPGQPEWHVILFAHGARAQWSSDVGRWWSIAPYVGAIANGTVTLTIPLDSPYWINVQGSHADADFRSAIANVNALGITFGGGCFTAHGVFVTSGFATARLLDFRVAQ